MSQTSVLITHFMKFMIGHRRLGICYRFWLEAAHSPRQEKQKGVGCHTALIEPTKFNMQPFNFENFLEDNEVNFSSEFPVYGGYRHLILFLSQNYLILTSHSLLYIFTLILYGYCNFPHNKCARIYNSPLFSSELILN